jgi:porphobilinogen synthase
MGYPTLRLRRLRKTEMLRRIVRETQLTTTDLIYPLFIVEGEDIKEPIPSMPDQFRFSVDKLIHEAKEIRDLGIPSVLLFGIPDEKNPVGSEAYAPDGIVQKAIRSLKQCIPDLIIVTDVCLCEYTDHGHCGYINGDHVDNDATVELLAQTAVSHAQCGADIVAPSAMMDGQVAAIRKTLDDEGFQDLPILGYAAKFASAFYGPFREAAESVPQFSDRQSYQLDPGNAKEALREVDLDIGEGADIVMVKPALAYLDILHRVRESCLLPLAAYSVSGEYAMIKAAASAGWLDEDRVLMEATIAIKRAGADLIITYSAKEVARILGGR